MPPIPEDPEREQRIENEVVVDAYDEYEQALGWWTYLDNEIHFPFTATCIAPALTSPLQVGEQVEVTGLPDEEACLHGVLALIRWQGRELAVPLAQLQPLPDVDESTRQAVEDWHYWVGRGNEM